MTSSKEKYSFLVLDLYGHNYGLENKIDILMNSLLKTTRN